MTSQTAHTKYKWPLYATEWTSPHENFLRTPLLADSSDKNQVELRKSYEATWLQSSKSQGNGLETETWDLRTETKSRNSITDNHEKVPNWEDMKTIFSKHVDFSYLYQKKI